MFLAVEEESMKMEYVVAHMVDIGLMTNVFIQVKINVLVLIILNGMELTVSVFLASAWLDISVFAMAWIWELIAIDAIRNLSPFTGMASVGVKTDTSRSMDNVTRETPPLLQQSHQMSAELPVILILRRKNVSPATSDA